MSGSATLAGVRDEDATRGDIGPTMTLARRTSLQNALPLAPVATWYFILMFHLC